MKPKINSSTFLTGTVTLAGAKNSALCLLAAGLLNSERVTLTRYPAGLLDAQVHIEMLEALGKTARVTLDLIEIDEVRLPDTVLDWREVERMIGGSSKK